MGKRKKNRKNYNNYLLFGTLGIIILIVLIIFISSRSNNVIDNYTKLYEFNSNGFNDKKYNVGTNDYFLYKSNQIFYYLYNNTDIDENTVYDTMDLDSDFVSYLTNIVYSNGNNTCYSKEMINSMTYYLLGRGIKIDNNSNYYKLKNNNICFGKFNYKFENMINTINIEDKDGLKYITFNLDNIGGKYTLIYEFDYEYNNYYLYKYSYKIEYNKDKYVYDEDAKEYIIMGQD